jgi:hypothetical protein
LVVVDNLLPQYDDSMEDEDDPCSIVFFFVDERPKGRATGDDSPPHRVAVRAFAVVPKK